VHFPLVREGLANRVAVWIPRIVAGEDQMAAVSGLVRVDLVRAAGNDIGRVVLLTSVRSLGDGEEAEGRGVVEVRDGLLQVEGDRIPVAGDGLVEQILAALVVRTVVLRQERRVRIVLCRNI